MNDDKYLKILEKASARKHLKRTPVEMRQDFESLAYMFPIEPDMICQSVRFNGLAAEWIAPPGCSARGVVLYMHGGGYMIGSIRTHRAMAGRIARAAGKRCLLIAYRLAPENPFPAALEDAVQTYQTLTLERAPSSEIAFAGDSAGGGLAVAALAALRDRGIPLPAGAALLSPWTDLTGSSPSIKAHADRDPFVEPGHLHMMADAYLKQTDPRNPYASPLYADLSGLPPLFIQVGTSECLLDDALRLAQKAKAAGISVELEKWKDKVHMWQYFAPIYAPGQAALESAGAFIRRLLGSRNDEWHGDTRRQTS